MKKSICCLLIIAAVFSLCGCFTKSAEKSLNFYYVRASYVYGKEDGVMVSESYKTTAYSDEQTILGEYLKGPQGSSLISPFPDGTMILEFLHKEDALYITLSSHIVALSKAKQVLACVCLARTAMELTGVNAVHFQSDSATFTRMDPITIDSNSLLLYDNYDSTTADGAN